jgi:NAD-dependent DNA ligase
MAIRQGTTPTHTFNLPFDVSTLKVISIAYGQKTDVLFVKRLEDMTVDGSTVRVTLTQKDTLKMDPRRDVEIQVRVVTHNDEALASDIFTVPIDRVIECEVLK